MSGMPLGAVLRGWCRRHRLDANALRRRLDAARARLSSCWRAVSRCRDELESTRRAGSVCSLPRRSSPRLAWAGHGAATEDVPFDAIHLPADILHLLAAGAWLGALLPLVILLAQARRDSSPQAVAVARAATLRFSVLGISCVGTLLVTGVVNTWFLSGSVPALLGTLYGQLLLVKIALFAAMIAVAGINQRRLLPRLADVASDAALRLRPVGNLAAMRRSRQASVSSYSRSSASSAYCRPGCTPSRAGRSRSDSI